MASPKAKEIAEKYSARILGVKHTGKTTYQIKLKDGRRIVRSVMDCDADHVLCQLKLKDEDGTLTIKKKGINAKIDRLDKEKEKEMEKLKEKEESESSESSEEKEEEKEEIEEEKPVKEVISEFAQEIKEKVEEAKPEDLIPRINAVDVSVAYPRLPTLKSLDIPVGEDKYKGQSIFILGQSEISGKTTLAANIFETYFKGKGFITLLFAPNGQNPIYSRFTNAIQFDTFLPYMMRVLKDINRVTDNHYKFLVVIDDVVDLRDSSAIRDLVLTMRNANVYSIIIAQYASIFAKAVRTNFRYIFLGNYNRADGIDAIPTMLPSLPGLPFGMKGSGENKRMAKFENYKRITKDYNWIVIDPEGKEWVYQSQN